MIFPWAQAKNLASKGLSLAANQVADDWLTHHGLHPVLIETFVDTGRFTGASYKAANGLRIGQSDGKKGSKNTVERNPKAVFVYPLREEYRTVLTQNRIWLKPTKKRTKQSARNGAAEPPRLTENDPLSGCGSA